MMGCNDLLDRCGCRETGESSGARDTAQEFGRLVRAELATHVRELGKETLNSSDLLRCIEVVTRYSEQFPVRENAQVCGQRNAVLAALRRALEEC